MLRITFRDALANNQHIAKKVTTIWEHGTKYKDSLLDWDWEIISVEASEKELIWIGQNFTGIPKANAVNNPIQKWRGEFAQFIYDHLPRSKE